MESHAIFWTDCQRCEELIAVEICRNCLDKLFKEGINLQGECSDDERKRVEELNLNLLCKDCRLIVTNAICDECNEIPNPIVVLTKKGKKLAKNFTLGAFGPPTHARVLYSYFPEIDFMISSIADRIVMDLPGLVFSNRESPATQGGIFIPFESDSGGINARGMYQKTPSNAIIKRMNDVAQAIWELIIRGDLTNPKDDAEKFEHELNKLVKRVFTE